MEWDKEHYEEIKDFMKYMLERCPWCYDQKKPLDWAIGHLPLVSHCIANEDYEGAKATSDAIRDFLNSLMPEGDKIPDNATLKLPKYEQIEVRGIICMVDPNNPLKTKAEWV